MSRIAVYVCAAAWLACQGGAIVALGAPAEADGFLRGANRIEGFLTWQFAALGVAIVGAIARRLSPPPRSRVLTATGYGPIALSGLLALVLAGVIAWAAFSLPTDSSLPAGTPLAATTPSQF